MNYTDKDAIERIAKAYAFSQDALLSIDLSDVHNMRKLIQAQFAYLSEKVYFDFVKADPYTYVKIEELDADWRNGIIKVNTTGNESELWGPLYNLQFRAIHDYIHCVHRLDFNYLSELRAYTNQLEFSLTKFGEKFPYMNWELYEKVLRSEIIYQAAAKEHYGEFHVNQKIILRDL